MQKPLPSLIGGLFLLNFCLQVLDGLVTYHAVSVGVLEGNPLIRATMTQWEVGWELLCWKVFACGCLAFSSCILAMAALPYIFWRIPETRFALVVSMLLVYRFLALASLAVLRAH